LNRAAPFLLLVGLASFVGIHLAIVVELARRREWGRAAIALFVMPCAPWWAWERGLRRRSLAWLGTVGIYTLGVVIG
jgi:hypothetical protein